MGYEYNYNFNVCLNLIVSISSSHTSVAMVRIISYIEEKVVQVHNVWYKPIKPHAYSRHVYVICIHTILTS